MDQPSTPIQVAKAWLAAQTPGAALAGVPVTVLLEHFLAAQARSLPSAGHELQVLGVLVEHWLKRMRNDLDSFPPEAIPVLEAQKKALQAMYQDLFELQTCLRSLQLSPPKPLLAPKRGRQRPPSWQVRALEFQDKAQQV